MGKTTQKLGVAFLSATLLLSVAPGVANAATVNANTAIGKYGQAHQGELGKPLTDEQKFANGASAQEFEHGLVTYSQRTGTRTLTNAQEIQAFKNAGGVEKFGALESGSWNNTFCGQSVTTFDGKTRWMVVVDAKTQPSSSVDLNSAEGNQWKTDRTKSFACFPDNAPVIDQPAEPTDPAQPENPVVNLDWSKATFVSDQKALLLITETTAYVTAADANGARVANAPVYEVEWLKSNEDARTIWNGEKFQTSKFLVLGQPTSVATWNGDTSTQVFEYGTVTFTRGATRPVVELTREGIKKLEAASQVHGYDIYATDYKGNLTALDSRFSYEKATGFTYVYDSQADTGAWMDPRVFDEFIKDPTRFGTLKYSGSVGDGRGGPSYNYMITYFDEPEGGEAQVTGFMTKSVSVWSDKDGSYLIDNEPAPAPLTDPADVDWSQHAYLKGNQQALYYQDGDSALIIAANPDGTPKAGAKAVRSDVLGFQMTRFSRFDNNFAEFWAYGSPYTDSIMEPGALGLPLADGRYVEEAGQKYYLQDFEGGSIKWAVPESRLKEVDTSKVEVTLNALGEARLAANDPKLPAVNG